MSETAAEPPQDEGSSLNSPRNLALEATFINHNFSQQVLKRKWPVCFYVKLQKLVKLFLNDDFLVRMIKSTLSLSLKVLVVFFSLKKYYLRLLKFDYKMIH